MAQRASLRDQTSLAVEKRRSNRTVYILRMWCLSSLESQLSLRSRATLARVRVCRGGGPLCNSASSSRVVLTPPICARAERVNESETDSFRI